MSQNLRQDSCCALACVPGHAAIHWKRRHPFMPPHLLLAETPGEKSHETVAAGIFYGSGMDRDRRTQSRMLGNESRQPIRIAMTSAKGSLFENTIVPPNLKAALNHSGAFFGHFLCTSKESDSREARNVLRALARELLILISPQNSTRTWQGGSA